MVAAGTTIKIETKEILSSFKQHLELVNNKKNPVFWTIRYR